MPPLPRRTLVRLAAEYGPAVYPVARSLYEKGRYRQLAILHARKVAHGTFSSEHIKGETRWVVWSGDDPIAAYPDDLSGDLAAQLTHARPDRRQDPDDLPVRRTAQALAERVRAARERTRRTGRRMQAGRLQARSDDVDPGAGS